MTIQAAIERAKQLRKDREKSGMPATSSPPPPPVEIEITSRYARHETPRVAPSDVHATPSFDVVPYDPALSVANRLLVPEFDSTGRGGALAAYRMLRARVLQRVRIAGWSALALTSPGPEEGKTVTAINLALTIAREKLHDVYLLDLDMRRPSVFRYLGIQPKEELVNYFSGQCSPENALLSPGIPNLILAGNIVSTEQASELLATMRLQELLSFIRRSSLSPLILVDLPPVLSTDDALVVAPRVDATLLVASEGRTRREGVTSALQVLHDFPVAGVILNRSHDVVSDYYTG